MKYLIILFCFLLPVFVQAKQPKTSPITAEKINKDIETLGAKEVILRMDTDDKHPNAWEKMLDEMDSGKPEWLEIIKKLAPVSDGGPSEDLGITLAYALPNNPAGVLKMIHFRDSYTIEHICGTPFLEPELPFVKKYLKRAIPAVKNLKDPQVEELRVQCLAELEKSKEFFLKLEKSGKAIKK